jgi:hypothetical protein
MKDIKNCVVGVLLDGELQGTGYLATPELVITCAHVLTDDAKPPSKKSKISIRFHCNGEVFPVDVSTEWWSPANKDDVAVLKLKPGKSPPATAEVATLGRSVGRKDRDCEVFGYPDVANLNGLGGRARIIEDVRDFEGRSLLQLESSQVTCGYSGSPVLDPKTGEVIGTAVEIAAQARARYADHLHARLNDLAFATPMDVIAKIVVGLPVDSDDQDANAHEKARKRVRDAVLQILSEQTEVTNLLASKIDGMDKHSQQLLCGEIADHLLATSLDDFLALVVDGFQSHYTASREIANDFRKLATYVLPQIYKKSFLQEVRRRLNSVDNFLVIPGSHKSIIELMIAGADGRPLEFEDTWKFEDSIPTSKYELQPNAELGIVQGMVEEKFIDGFERAIMTKIGGLAQDLPDRTRALQKLLEKRRKREPPIRFFYIYPVGQSRVESLEKQYSQVVFIAHDRKHDDDDVGVLDDLKRLFCPEDHP